MSYDTNSSVHSRVISAFFDTQATATKAVSDLVAAGIPRQHITETGGQGGTGISTATTGQDDRGFWESLKDLFLPEDDRQAYAEGLRRGGYLVSVRADEANYDRVLDILDTDGSVDMDQREGQWRSEGWSGYTETGSTATAARTAGLTTATAAVASTATRPATGPVAAGQDDVVQLYEETLRVGKRDVNHGRVRLRSYVVETPVQETVSLRDEKVFVDRKAVDRPVAAGDALFQERVIEVEEYAEEAVIAKDARVTEEISLRKTSENRTQTVTDSVRRTEVEVQDDRKTGLTGQESRFSAQTDSSRIVANMDVISADGQKIGIVDHLDGPDRIKLAKTTSPDGQHHFVPLAWIDHVDQHIHLRKTLAEIKAGY